MTPKQKSLYFRAWADVRRVDPAADRHQLHIAALGHDKSSKAFTNRDLDLVLAEFYSISHPNSVDAQLRQHNMSRTRALHTINSFPPTYVLHILFDKYGTRDINQLTTPQLLQLAMTLHNRDVQPPADTEPDADPTCGRAPAPLAQPPSPVRRERDGVREMGVGLGEGQPVHRSLGEGGGEGNSALSTLRSTATEDGRTPPSELATADCPF